MMMRRCWPCCEVTCGGICPSRFPNNESYMSASNNPYVSSASEHRQKTARMSWRTRLAWLSAWLCWLCLASVLINFAVLINGELLFDLYEYKTAAKIHGMLSYTIALLIVCGVVAAVCCLIIGKKVHRLLVVCPGIIQSLLLLKVIPWAMRMFLR